MKCNVHGTQMYRHPTKLKWFCHKCTLPIKSDTIKPDTQLTKEKVMSNSVGSSQYHKKKFQPWDIWEEYNLDPWDADIVKRVLRDKNGIEGRKEDYEKIIHLCQYQLARIGEENAPKSKN